MHTQKLWHCVRIAARAWSVFNKYFPVFNKSLVIYATIVIKCVQFVRKGCEQQLLSPETYFRRVVAKGYYIILFGGDGI